LKEKDNNLLADDVREGITVVLSVKLGDPQFEGQTKNKLGNPEIRGYVEAVLTEYLNYYLEEHPGVAKKIINKAIISARARKAARAARDNIIRKGAIEGSSLPGKLSDCSSRNPEDSELFIVEGASAGGSAKDGRNSKTQAILPLRGKVLNVERARLDKMLANTEITNLIKALGVGIDEQFDMEGLRYHKVIIMTDADVDGSHIRTLLLTFFFRNMKPIIDAGHLYIAQPPFYMIQVGKKKHYAFTDEEKDALLKKLAKEKKERSKTAEDTVVSTIVEDEAEANMIKKIGAHIQRYKGLGEMNPEELAETTMDKDNRILWRVTVEDAEKADAVFNKLMGTEVELRKNFIQTRAKYVTDLDI
jgi:DNA gyrase subunit B